jgi:segregation and condensation protein B
VVVRRSRVEAVLYLAREPLSLRKLAQLANLADATEARTVIRSLQQRYDDRGSAFQVAQVAGGYQLLSRREFAEWIRPSGISDRELRLSPPALETLAVVAYRQPVLRADVEAIRGVACGEILRLLMDRDLLRIVGRSEELGRPLRYGTTKRFLEVFGLCNLDELPWASQLRRAPPAEDTSYEIGPESSGSEAGLTEGIEAA